MECIHIFSGSFSLGQCTQRQVCQSFLCSQVQDILDNVQANITIQNCEANCCLEEPCISDFESTASNNATEMTSKFYCLVYVGFSLTRWYVSVSSMLSLQYIVIVILLLPWIFPLTGVAISSQFISPNKSLTFTKLFKVLFFTLNRSSDKASAAETIDSGSISGLVKKDYKKLVFATEKILILSLLISQLIGWTADCFGLPAVEEFDFYQFLFVGLHLRII